MNERQINAWEAVDQAKCNLDEMVESYVKNEVTLDNLTSAIDWLLTQAQSFKNSFSGVSK